MVESVNKQIKYYDLFKNELKDLNDGLIPKKPIARFHPEAIIPEVIDKVLDLRKSFQLGSWRIKWYLERYIQRGMLRGLMISTKQLLQTEMCF
jgi:hypothetical protein